jgi:hypothetical protein
LNQLWVLESSLLPFQTQRGNPRFSQGGSLFNQLLFVFRTKVEMTQWGRNISTACPGHTMKIHTLARGTALLLCLQREEPFLTRKPIKAFHWGSPRLWRDTVRSLVP